MSYRTDGKNNLYVVDVALRLMRDSQLIELGIIYNLDRVSEMELLELGGFLPIAVSKHGRISRFSQLKMTETKMRQLLERKILKEKMHQEMEVFFTYEKLF